VELEEGHGGRHQRGGNRPPRSRQAYNARSPPT
jgi:hypothetical protein